MSPLCRKTCWPSADVLAGEEDLAALVDDPRRDRRLRHVGAVGEQPEDEEADEDDQGDGLDPALRDQELAPSGVATRLILRRRPDRISPG